MIPVLYVGTALWETLYEGHHPLSPQVVVIAATAFSMAALVWMARRALLPARSVVAFAAVVAAIHSWAVTCLDPRHDASHTFAVTILLSGLLVRRPREVGTVATASCAAFASATMGGCIHDPADVGLSIAASIVVAIGLASARAVPARACRR